MKVILAWIFAVLIASAAAGPAIAEPVRRAGQVVTEPCVATAATFPLSAYHGAMRPGPRTPLAGAPHNGTFALLRGRPEVAAKVYDFLRDGRAADLPAEVWLDPVTFARPDFPPSRRAVSTQGTGPGARPGLNHR